MSAQLAVIILQIFYYSNQLPQMAMFLAVLGSVVGAAYMHLIPMPVLVTMQACTIPITMLGKVRGIMEECRRERVFIAGHANTRQHERSVDRSTEWY